jgi:CRP-like cAMP-binding protein
VKGDRVARPKLEAVLATVPLFEGLSKRQLRQVASLAEPAHFMQGASIVREGDPGDTFYVILEGQAKVSIAGRRVSRLLPGDHFGEISLLDGGPRTATVTTETPVTLVMIGRKAFLKLLQVDPALALGVMGSLARMIRRVDHSIRR